MKPSWVPIPYYNNSPLSKLGPIPKKLPHKPGFIPDFSKTILKTVNKSR
jgi:hypothetical protein